jgi:hypothetical protein
MTTRFFWTACARRPKISYCCHKPHAPIFAVISRLPQTHGPSPSLVFLDNVPFQQLIDMEQRTVIIPARTITFATPYPFSRVFCPPFSCPIQFNVQIVFLHTMRNEHFGISLVEAMAAGPVALVV